MKNMLYYKGYYGSVTFSEADEVFYGKVEFIRSLINYEGTDVQSLKSSFEEAVDDYLDSCESEGIEPDKPFKGSFNVRTGEELHRKAALYAKEHDINLNALVSKALDQYLTSETS